MPRGMHKSRSLRRVVRITPGKRRALHYRQRKPGGARCGRCRRHLPGVPAMRRISLSAVPKPKRRPERPFGGVLCSSCLRDSIKQKARQAAQAGEHAAQETAGGAPA